MQEEFESDIITTSGGELKLIFIGHASLMFEFDNRIIHIDPVVGEADYSTLPAADLILITHEHFDHLDGDAIRRVTNKRTQLIYTRKCSDQVAGGKVLNNEAKIDLEWIKIEAVPAYNIVHERSPGKPFHPQGVGNGYVLTIADKRIYVAGDTESIPEMRALKNIDITFLPMNLPYTMTPEMVADATQAFRPKILYPYHYGSTDPRELVNLLKSEKDIEVRIRQLQ